MPSPTSSPTCDCWSPDTAPNRTCSPRASREQTVFRFVHKPASAQRLKLFLDAVGRQSDAPRPATPPQVIPVPLVAQASEGARNPRHWTGRWIEVAPDRHRHWHRHRAGHRPGRVDVLAQGGSRQDRSTGAAAGSSAATSAPAGDLIGKADQAFAAGRYVATDGTSAAELYRDALKIDSKSDVARSGFDRSIEYGLRTAEEALLASRVDAAAGVAENPAPAGARQFAARVPAGADRQGNRARQCRCNASARRRRQSRRGSRTAWTR